MLPRKDCKDITFQALKVLRIQSRISTTENSFSVYSLKMFVFNKKSLNIAYLATIQLTTTF